MASVLQQLSTLNPEQHQAVTAAPCHQLIIAGAGSGKTRVLVHRIAYLIEHFGVRPYHIMAVTFTNKAANTLKKRTQDLCLHALEGTWIGTFHSICHKLLRMYAFDFGVDATFQIIDQEDQLKLIKTIQNDLNIDEKQFPAKKTQYHIGQFKEAGLRANSPSLPNQNIWDEHLIDVYQRYERITQKEHLLDFNELLLKVVETLTHKPGFASQIQARFRHLLVDEFQDSNPLQYQLIQLLAGKQSFVSIVGDDDQSIYSWRGARIDNMLSFPKDFPDVMTVRLERNYRSTEYILDAANSLIEHNQNRLGKQLKTEEGLGEKIKLFSAYNEYEEARYIAQSIANRAQHGTLSEHAVLYRSNAQSRLIEEMLTRHNLPYRVYGGLRFFDRSEIKDILAYMRLVVHPQDSTAFLRVINTPARGIGSASVEKIQEYTEGGTHTLWEAAERILQSPSLSSRAKNSLNGFFETIGALHTAAHSISFSALLERIIADVHYLDYLQKSSPDQAKSKTENLEELINACHQFEQEHPDQATITTAAMFLANITLDNPPNNNEEQNDFVQLMTLHSAKGLEFDCVFLAGMEEGLCPHKMAIQDGRELEEERRLCYVGITRARKHLYITHAENRKLYQQDNYQMRSRFLSEIPAHLFEVDTNYGHHGANGHTHANTQPAYAAPAFLDASRQAKQRWKLGQHVMHTSFGPGVVLNIEGTGDDERVQIRFQQHGVKWLLSAYAKLEHA